MRIEDLQEEVTSAEEALRKAHEARAPAEKRLAAFARLAEAQRALAAARGEEYAASLNLGFVPEAAVSEPVFFETERASLLSFSAVREAPASLRGDAGYGLVEIVGCVATSFSSWDEEWQRDPLHSKGLSGYGAFEIVNSGWIRALREHGISGSLGAGPMHRHFLFRFHDSTFQCIASDLRGTTIPRPFENVLAEVRKRW